MASRMNSGRSRLDHVAKVHALEGVFAEHDASVRLAAATAGREVIAGELRAGPGVPWAQSR